MAVDTSGPRILLLRVFEHLGKLKASESEKQQDATACLEVQALKVVLGGLQEVMLGFSVS